MNPSHIEYNGERHTVEEWAEIYGLDGNALLARLRHNGYNLALALSEHSPVRVRLITWRGKTQSLSQWAEELGVPYFCLRSRLNNLRWTVEKAFTTPYGGRK